MPRLPRARLLALAVCLCLYASRRADAAEPLLVNGVGQPIAWSTLPIPYNPDQGTLGALDNASARQFVHDRFQPWTAVSTAAVSFVDTGQLPTNVNATNVGSYLGVCGDHRNPIIFDTDGSIIRNLFGVGNENIILGAAGPDCATSVPPVITEASAILNGRFIDGVISSSNPEISLEAFGAVFTHEFGHYAGLGHSQINLAEAADGNPANDNTIATMFPILINGTEQATLELDDRVGISMLYPAPSFFAATGSIRGTILRADSSTPFQGAYVIARSLADPRLQAVGVTSGFLFNPGAGGGLPPQSLFGYYELDGLSPGASYTVEIEAVSPGFTGGSGVGPVDPPAAVPVPEFWNGPNEAATNPPDDPAQATPITVSAGIPITGIDVVMNSVSGTLPANDLCADAATIDGSPFSTTVDTTGAGESAADPTPTCLPFGYQSSNTVWYTLTAPADGVLSLDTCGSDFDTLLSIFRGSCATLIPMTCNDDVGPGDAGCGSLQSRLNVDVTAGESLLIEVAQVGPPRGGTLVFTATLGPRTCVTGDCWPGRGGVKSECFAEWLIHPQPTVTGRPPTTLSCHDGDSCDTDGDATNHRCTFQLALCLNNTDPTLAKCTPSDVAKVDLRTPDRNGLSNHPEDTANADALLTAIAGIGNGLASGTCSNLASAGSCIVNADCDAPGRHNGRCHRFVGFAPPLSTRNLCSVPASVVVPLTPKASGGFAAAAKHIRLRTTNSTRVTDSDALTLRCLPAP